MSKVDDLAENNGMAVCMRCEETRVPNDSAKGSLALEILLWVCAILPGVVYSIWRRTTQTPSCPVCGSKELIPAHVPKGERISDDL
jgi:hypothetical protein